MNLRILTLLIWVSAIACYSQNEQIANSRFQKLWSDFDLNYSYFKEKNIDWDSIKKVYSTKFSKRLTAKKEALLFAEVIGCLKDCHVSLTTSYGVYRYSKLQNTSKEEGFKKLFPTVVFTNKAADMLMNSDSVLLLRIKSLGAEIIFNNRFWNNISKSKGLIVDLSDNYGGNEKYARNFVQRFVKDTITFKSVRYTTGEGRNHFTDWVNAKLVPDHCIFYSKPLVTIINANCFSSTEAFALMLKSIPGCTLIGVNTGGASGFPENFVLDNGWSYTISTWQEADVEHNLIEDKGVAPHKVIPMELKYSLALKEILKAN
ncbi:MAG: S41 family peptidase [Bacteroidales bacterium]